MKTIQDLLRDESGVGIVEYAMLSAMGAAALIAFGGAFSQQMTGVGTKIGTSLNSFQIGSAPSTTASGG